MLIGVELVWLELVPLKLVYVELTLRSRPQYEWAGRDLEWYWIPGGTLRLPAAGELKHADVVKE